MEGAGNVGIRVGGNVETKRSGSGRERAGVEYSLRAVVTGRIDAKRVEAGRNRSIEVYATHDVRIGTLSFEVRRTDRGRCGSHQYSGISRDATTRTRCG